MSTTIEQLAEQAMNLPVESRARLADLLIESLDTNELGRSSNCGSRKPSDDEMKCARGK